MPFYLRSAASVAALTAIGGVSSSGGGIGSPAYGSAGISGDEVKRDTADRKSVV